MSSQWEELEKIKAANDTEHFPRKFNEETRLTDREYIEIRGAKETNLKGVSLNVPKRKLTVFTGEPGLRKSAFVFDTIAADACAMEISDRTAWALGLNEPSGAPLLTSLRQILD